MRGPKSKQIKRARSLRSAATNAELMLWRYLRNRQLGGLKFVRQEPIGPYYADFVCREARLIIEVDGGQHADNPADRRRDRSLAKLGYRVIRVWNNEVLGNIEGVFQMLLSECGAGPSPQPSPRGHGEREEPASAGG